MYTNNKNQESPTLPANSTAADTDTSTLKMGNGASTPEIALPPLDLSLVDVIPVGPSGPVSTIAPAAALPPVEIEYDGDDSSSEASPIVEPAAKEETVSKSPVDAVVAVSPTLGGEAPKKEEEAVVNQVNKQGFFTKEATHAWVIATAQKNTTTDERTPLLPSIALPSREEVSEKEEGRPCCRCSIS